MTTTPKPKNPPAKDLAYYITMFKLEGHETWRCYMAQRKDSFKSQEQKNWGKNPPKITKEQTLRIDKITGQITTL